MRQGNQRSNEALRFVTLCTGNVARSVMLGYMFTSIAEVNGFDWQIRSAGTHVIEGNAMSSRTKSALVSLEDLGAHHYNAHRSHQLSDEDVAWADVIVTSEAAHVNFVRKNFPDGAPKTVMLDQFIVEAPRDASFDEQIGFVALRQPSMFFDVEDPAGGDQETYDACVRQLWAMAKDFSAMAGGERT